MGYRYFRSILRTIASKQTLVLLAIVVIMLSSFRCMKAPVEPKMPSWQTQISVPIIDRTYYFSDLVAKDNKFETLVDGEVVYRPSNVDNTPTSIPMPTLTPVAASVSNKLGTVPLSLPAIPEVDLSMSDLLNGQTPPQIPWIFGDASVTENLSVVSDTSLFDYVVFDNARMTVTIQNTMNFDVLFPSGISAVNVFSASDTNQVLATFTPGVVRAHSSASASAMVSGAKMSSKIKLKFVVQTSGMNGTVLDPTGKIAATMAIDGGSTGTSATMQSAKVKVAGDFGVAKTEGSLQVLDDSLYIAQADFSSGGFDLKITNNVSVDVVAGLVLKEVINKKTGQPFQLRQNGTGAPSDSVVIARNSTFVQVVDLSDYKFVSQNIVGVDTMPTNGVHYTLTLKTLKATPDKRVISVNDSISANLIPHAFGGVVQPYTVSRFVGVVQPTKVTINESVQTNFGDVTDKFSADSIKTDNATITLKLYSPTSYPADLNLKVTAWRGGVKGLSMTVPAGNGGLNGSYRVIPGDTARIVFNKATTTNGTTIDQFLNSFLSGGKIQLPDKLVLEGMATIEPADAYKNGANGTVGTATDHDSIYSSVEFVFPMRFAVNNGVFQDTVSFTNNTADDQDKLNLLETGKVTFEVENYFPVDGDLSLMLMRSKMPGDTVLNVTKTPLHITGAQYNPSGTNTPSKSYSYITIANGDAAKFPQAAFSAIKAAMQTGNNKQPVTFRSTDQIRVKAYGTFNVNVDFHTMTTDTNKQ